MPHRQQIQFNYCVPASILMWRLWDGLPEISQDTIWTWLGGPPCTPEEVPPGVNHFTNTYDAVLDEVYGPSTTEWEELFARQIYYTASEWLLAFCRAGESYCAQIISESATYGWYANYQTYGGSVDVYGGCTTYLGLRRRCD